jgi:general secretion pathway protein L
LLFQGGGEERRPIGELDPGAPAGLKAMLASARRSRARVLIELPAEQVIARTVTFPAQVRANLAQVVGYEIDRVTPFRADQVCFDFRLREGAPRAEKIEVELAVCRRDLIQGWIERLRGAGAQVEQVTWQNAWPKADLLPREERPRRASPAFALDKLLLLLVVGLAAASLISVPWQKGRILEAREATARRLKSGAEEVFALRTAIERAREGSLAVLEAKSEQPRMMDLLRELTERLPDDTWVQNLDFRDGEVQIRGESSQAAALIGLLEQAPGFTDVAFRSPVVQVATTGQERFHIAFKLVREATP